VPPRSGDGWLRRTTSHPRCYRHVRQRALRAQGRFAGGTVTFGPGAPSPRWAQWWIPAGVQASGSVESDTPSRGSGLVEARVRRRARAVAGPAGGGAVTTGPAATNVTLHYRLCGGRRFDPVTTCRVPNMATCADLRHAAGVEEAARGLGRRARLHSSSGVFAIHSATAARMRASSS
jgi:hypothetical protein